MASPTSAINRFDLSLSYSEFDALANRKNFIGLKVLPPVLTQQESASFLKLKVAASLGPIRETQRSPKAGYRRDDFEWTTDSYKTEDHGWEAEIDDRQVKRYGEIRAERLASQRAINNVLERFEYDVAAAVFNTSTWTGASLTTGVGTAWTTPSTATPITDIDAAIEKVITSSGMRPNSLILSDYALLKMSRTAQVQDLLKYSGKDDPKALWNVMKEMFMLDNIIVGKGMKNTAKEGQTGTFSRLWDTTKCMVCHINNDGMNGDLEAPVPNIGRTVMWQDEAAPLPGEGSGEIGVIVEEYRDETHRGNVVRARNDRQTKVIHPEAGHLLTGVTA